MALAEPVKIKCPEQTSPSPRFRICTMDMAIMCTFHKDGSAHQYRGSSSCVCANTGADSYYRGYCNEEEAQKDPLFQALKNLN